MLLHKLTLFPAAALAAPIVYWTALAPPAATMIEPEMIMLKPGQVIYPPAGDFMHSGKPVNAPLKLARFPYGLQIMKHQITQAEYWKCVVDRGCPPAVLPGPASADEPMVGVNWLDAEAYAVWYSGKIGKRHRLPTDEEWAFAAGSLFRDEGWPDIDSNNPAQRWLARYEREFSGEPVDRMPRTIGSFGVNENGLLDIGGNVWEWTDTCFVRVGISDSGDQSVKTTNCGVRVVEGRHRTYMTDFIRDARSGGCAVGKPPVNLGFRLVRGE